MKSFSFCPITNKKISKLVVRIHALIVVSTLLAFLITLHIIPGIFLFTDFLVRVLDRPQLSLFGHLARFIAIHLPINQGYENAGPKLFAARIGLLFSAIILFSLLFGSHGVAIITASLFALFAFLEGVFGFCVACLVYPYLAKSV
jgi:hypothetical protein